MTSKCCGEKTVIVAVYSEKLQPPSQHHHHHHHHHHFHGRRTRRGYNRKAELLDYARNLRASAQHQNSHNKQLPTVNQIAAAEKKPKRSSHPTCLGKWKFIIPTFVRSMNSTKRKEKKKHENRVSAATKMTAIVKSMQMQKKTSFLSKLLRKLQKNR